MKRKSKILSLFCVLILIFSVCAAWGCGNKEFTVTFNGNGGTVYSGDTFQTVNSAEEIEEPVFVRTGYTFIGWDTDLDKLTASAFVNAEWQANEYEITFETDGGMPLDGITATYDRPLGELPVPQKDGNFTFSRWLYEKENVVVTADTVWTYPENACLKAVWTEHYAISYNLGTNGVLPADAPYDYTSQCEVTLASPTRTGYIFDGWTGEGITQPQKNVVIPAGSSGNKTFTANWTAKTYTVTFDYGDGETAGNKTLTFGSPVGELPVPSSGKNFAGWYYGVNKIKIDSDYIWNFDDDAPVFVARYADMVFTVSFKLECVADDGRTVQCTYNGKNYIAPVQLSVGETLGDKLVTVLPVNHKNRDYKFEGWYYGDVQITPSTVFSEEIFGMNSHIELTVKCTLEAIWTDYY